MLTFIPILDFQSTGILDLDEVYYMVKSIHPCIRIITALFFQMAIDNEGDQMKSNLSFEQHA